MVTWRDWLANRSCLGCCWLCDASLSAAETGLCQTCLADLPRLPPCPIRQARQSACRYWFCAYPWQQPVARLINQYKFHGRVELSGVLAPLLAAQVLASYRHANEPLPELLVAMPLTTQRWRQRGFNQAGLLAKQLAGLLNIDYSPGALKRFRQGRLQHQSTAMERWQNLHRAIHCTQSLTGQRVAVIDDVLTTGASVNAAAQALKKRGAGTVDAWTVAFTALSDT